MLLPGQLLQQGRLGADSACGIWDHPHGDGLFCSCQPLLTKCRPAQHLPPQIDFERDDIVTVENEYEILQLLMGDLREK